MSFILGLLLGYCIRGKKAVADSYSNDDCRRIFHCVASNRPYTTCHLHYLGWR